MRRTTLSLPGLSLAAALLLSGCAAGGDGEEAPATSAASSAASVMASDGPSDQASESSASQAPASASSATADEASSSDPAPSGSVSAEHNDADTMFAQMMIPHHQQAVEMADIVLEKDGVPEEVRSLAQDIKDAQAPEIERMTGMLQTWGEDTASDHMSHGGHTMDGMLSPDELRALREADGSGAADAFLSGMIAHHEGAVDMARAEIAQGANPEAKALAEDIVAAQQEEIAEMGRLLGKIN